MKLRMKDIILLLLFIMPLIGLSSCKDNDDGQSIIKDNDKAIGSTETAEYAEICVYVVGEVVNPGVYMLKSDARICDAIDAAGGFTEYAARDYLNLASKMCDGDKIVVYSLEQIQHNEAMSEQSTLVNINTASADKLMTLPGIGKSRANDIIKYREKNGRFETIEDIMKVSGIKESAFSKIEDLITVN